MCWKEMESNDLKKKLEGYLEKAKPMFENLELISPEKIDLEEVKKEFHEMALRYYQDARHFSGEGQYGKALAALEYAEGWLDAGKVLGIFKDGEG